MRRLLLPALLFPALAWADTSVSGDLQTTGQLGVGTLVPRARAEARMGSADAYAVKVSSPDGTFLFGVDRDGRVSVGVSSAHARVDVRGTGDAGDLGLLLRAGNSSSTISAAQIVFAYDSTGTYRHSLRTRHAAGQEDYNTIDFYLWRSTDDPAALGGRHVLSLQAVTSVSSGSFHVNPVGIGTYEVEVSSGSGLTGGGDLMYGSVAAHSSRALKSEIRPLEPGRAARAYEDVKGLRHVRFHYKMPNGAADGVLRRGLLFEEAPGSIRGPQYTLVVNRRVLNLELALQEAERRVQSLKRRIAQLEAGGRP